jgi:hypothetical protein
MASVKRHAIIVVPPGRGGKIRDIGLRRWLSRGTLACAEPTVEILNRVLPLLHHEVALTGLAALRFWGQTGERSAAWMAAADPVHLETMMNDLRLHALSDDELDVTEIKSVFDELQNALGGDGTMAFARIGSHGYLRGDTEMATSSVSAEIADGSAVGEFMPTASASDNNSTDAYHRLQSELQMSLHEQDINRIREAAGKRAVNSLWFWGGGVAPEKDVRPIPPLFSADPLFRGYWESCTGVVENWDGDFARCLELAISGFVVVTPDVADAARKTTIERDLENIRALLLSGEISKVTLLFRDGLSVIHRRFDRFKFWRGISPFVAERTADE